MYIDPTSGSLALQVLAAGALSAWPCSAGSREGTKAFFRSLLVPRPPVVGPSLASSFRDPSGFVYTRAGVLYRQVNRVFQDEFEAVAALGAVRRPGAAAPADPPPTVSLELAATRATARCSSPSPCTSSPIPTSGRSASSATRRCSRSSIQERALAGASPCATPAPTTSSSRPAARSSSTRSPSSAGRRARPGWRTASSASTSWSRWRS